jgi:uncharacterized protein (DUF58 family)
VRRPFRFRSDAAPAAGAADPAPAAEALAARLPALLVAAERVARTVAAGFHGRRRAGPGETFWQYRRYQPGESAAIDWRQSARGDHLYVRETEWSAAETVWLWSDPSPSMAWASRPELPQKRDRAVILALALASLALRGGERVGALGPDPAPVSGQGALARLAMRMPAGGTGLPAPHGGVRHGEMVLISDFLMPLEEIEAGLRRLAATGAGGHLLHILDPAEEDLPFSGHVRFRGLEGEGEVLIHRAELIRDAYAERMAAHRAGLAAIAAEIGWSCATHRSDQPPQIALLALHARLAGPRSRRS